MANKINLNDFAGGALAEKFNNEIKKITANLLDVNTEWKKTRKLIIELKFDTTEDRQFTNVEIGTKVKLAEPTTAATTLLIGKDMMNGEVLATEYKNQVPGQSVVAVKEDGEVTTTAEEKEKYNLEGIKIVK